MLIESKLTPRKGHFLFPYRCEQNFLWPVYTPIFFACIAYISNKLLLSQISHVPQESTLSHRSQASRMSQASRRSQVSQRSQASQKSQRSQVSRRSQPRKAGVSKVSELEICPFPGINLLPKFLWLYCFSPFDGSLKQYNPECSQIFCMNMCLKIYL